MNISTWSIKNPVPAILLFIMLTGLGLLGFYRLGIQDMPDMDLPTVQINASLEGTAPEQLESEVARKIEDQLTSIPQLDHITTTITDGNVSINVSFNIEKNGETALSEVRNSVNSIKAELPANMSEPTVSKINSAGAALLTYTIDAKNYDEKDLSWFIDNDLSKKLMAVQGVYSVKRIGGVDREVHINLDPNLMASIGVTPEIVSQQLKAVQKEASGGQGRVGDERQTTRTIPAVRNAEEIAVISIPLTNGEYIRLDQVAHVYDGYADRSTKAFFDGKPTLAFQITRTKGYADLSVVKDVRKAVQEFQKLHSNVKITEVSNVVDPIEENYHGSMHMLYEGAILAIIVVWLFLRNWRTTFISAIALPLSIIPTFYVLSSMGYSLNVLTLLALSLVVGILVDDAIVEIENIERHLQLGKTPLQAAMEAANEIGLAVVATTFTLIAIFLPTAFMSGIAGKFFRQFGITASVAIFTSLLVARLLTPMMAAYMLKPTKKNLTEYPQSGWLIQSYRSLVQWTLKHRKTTILLTSGFFIFTLFIATKIPTAFLPVADKSQSNIIIELQPGATLDDTSKISQRASQLIHEIPEVKSVFIAAGTASSGSGMDASSTSSVTSSTLTVDLVARENRQLKQVDIEREIRRKLQSLAGVRITVGGGSNGEKLQITLAGDNPHLLNETASKVENQLRSLHDIGSVTSNAALEQPEIQIKPDLIRSAELGITSESLANVIRYATYGEYSTNLPKLSLDQRQIALRVQMDPNLRKSLDDIAALRVAGNNGMVSLGSIAEIKIGGGPAQINRLDRSRNITLSVELNGRPVGEVQKEAMQLSSLKDLPQGIHLIEQGETQRMGELFTSFGTAMAIGVFCVYAVLVLLFHDFMQPGTILSALPLALGGAMLSLYICNLPFSMPVVIGILMLLGIVTKNSILLVDYAVMAYREGMSRTDAIVDACIKRARPIVMTTIAMGAGMLPNALGIGAEPSFRQPTAIVVIGGLITSTILSLVVVPVVFTYVDDLLRWLKKCFYFN